MALNEVTMVIPKKSVKPRNLIACSPIMKKGGAHQKNQSAFRSQNRQQLISQLESWQEDLAFERELKQSITNRIDSDAFFMSINFFSSFYNTLSNTISYR